MPTTVGSQKRMRNCWVIVATAGIDSILIYPEGLFASCKQRLQGL